MPEGDTLHRTAAALHRALAGRVVTAFETVVAPLARAAEAAGLVGRAVVSARAFGKHCLLAFSGELVLRTHLRMNGSWHLYRPGDRWRRPRAEARLVLRTEEVVAVGFSIPVSELVREEDLARGPVGRLGPDLLAPGFEAEEAVRRLGARPDRPICEALLDQRALAGVGNVFKSEVLFVAGVDPFTPVRALTVDALRAIVAIARRQLRANAGEGPMARRGRNTTGSLHPGGALWVYGRAAEPCRRCGTAIEVARRGVDPRLTYTCPRCQPALKR